MQELQVRWMQWGAFMPLMRNHCSSPMVDELYRFGNPGDWAFDVQKQYIQLRYRMLPYIYSNAGDVVQGNGSMIRPLVMDFAKDKKAINRNDEYLFGRSILVRPVTDPLYTWNDENKKGHLTYPDISKASAAVKVYLPAGYLLVRLLDQRETTGRTGDQSCLSYHYDACIREGRSHYPVR
jgi:alpha-D-xyloside xylohydrolase